MMAKTMIAFDAHYALFEKQVELKVAAIEVPLFRTDAISLQHMYLNGLPTGVRKHYNCSACKGFLLQYGGLATIGEDGVHKSVLWEGDFGEHFDQSVGTMRVAVNTARVIGTYVHDGRKWGYAERGGWTHLHGSLKRDKVPKAAEVEALHQEQYRMMRRYLADYSEAALDTALRIAERVPSGHQMMGQAKWFRDLQRSLRGKHSSQYANLVWRAVATAPAGFCHVAGNMLGEILKMIEEGKGFDEIARRYGKMADPTTHQRQTAPVTDQHVKKATELVAEMGLEKSFERRFAKLDEVAAYWRPIREVIRHKSGGMFDHLKSPGATAPAIEMPPRTMTWELFRKEVLPSCRSIDLMVPMRGNFFAFVTACDPEAPPILQWDRPDRRNPVSWFVYASGSYAVQWGLSGKSWCPVDAIAERPSQWREPGGYDHHGSGAYFVLRGAKHQQERKGGALFPDCVRSELHPIRRVVEAYSEDYVVKVVDEPACGVAINHDSPAGIQLRVNGTDLYTIDRWR
jgi:hypothetical protein